MFGGSFSGGKEMFMGTSKFSISSSIPSFVKTTGTEVQALPTALSNKQSLAGPEHTKRSPKSQQSSVAAPPTTSQSAPETAMFPSSNSTAVVATSRRMSEIFTFGSSMTNAMSVTSSISDSITSDSSKNNSNKTNQLSATGKPVNVYKEILNLTPGQVIEALGLNGDAVKTRNALFEAFQRNCEAGNASGEQPFLSLEKFVMDMIKRGNEPIWSDAAYKAFNVHRLGKLNSFEYVIAVTSLDVSNEAWVHNPTWMLIRRHLVFTYYNHSSNGLLTEHEFLEMMKDVEATPAPSLAQFGVVLPRPLVTDASAIMAEVRSLTQLQGSGSPDADSAGSAVDGEDRNLVEVL